MTSKEFDSRKHNKRTDDFIQDYLSDVWGTPAAPNVNVCDDLDRDVLNIDEEVFNSKPLVLEKIRIPKNMFLQVRERAVEYTYSPLRHPLVSTIKIHKHTSDKSAHSQVESLVILMTNLYFLRRPLPPRTRQFILDLSETAIDDFNAAYWVMSSNFGGVTHEV